MLRRSSIFGIESMAVPPLPPTPALGLRLRDSLYRELALSRGAAISRGAAKRSGVEETGGTGAVKLEAAEEEEGREEGRWERLLRALEMVDMRLSSRKADSMLARGWEVALLEEADSAVGRRKERSCLGSLSTDSTNSTRVAISAILEKEIKITIAFNANSYHRHLQVSSLFPT